MKAYRLYLSALKCRHLETHFFRSHEYFRTENLPPPLLLRRRRRLLLLLLLLLLTLQPVVGFDLLHPFIPGFSVFDEICPILHFYFLYII